MNKETRIRQATFDDLDSIAVLWKEFMDFHRVRDSHFKRSSDGHTNFAEFIGKKISSDDSFVLVGESNGNVVAYCLAIIANNPPVFEEKQYGALFDLAVTESFRRQGIGEDMYQMVHDWFKQKNIHRIEIRVALSNEVSTAFWRKMGFSPYLETVVKEI
jgi:ribosomal protein S18 acetylase RimI-like enzyme